MALNAIINSIPNSVEGEAPTSTHGNGLEQTPVTATRTTDVATLVENPSPLSGPLVWSGADFHDSNAYTFKLSPEDVDEIEKALQEFKCMKSKLIINHFRKNGILMNTYSSGSGWRRGGQIELSIAKSS